jgi:hypothetical protein
MVNNKFMVFGHKKGTTDEGQVLVSDDITAKNKTDAIRKAKLKYPSWTVVSALSPEEKKTLTYNDIKDIKEMKKHYMKSLR